MAAIVADDSLIEQKLRELLQITEENGASFHSRMTINSSNNVFRIGSNLDPGNTEPLIHIPDSCLPRVDDFRMRLEGNDITFNPLSDSTTPLHTEVFGRMLELYNLSRKLEQHKNTFPWITLANHRNILSHLHKGRSDSNKYDQHLENGDSDRLILESFLGTRFIYHDYQNGDDTSATIMPIIDYLNHHGSASPYLNASTETDIKQGLMVRNSKAQAGSDECFSRYNKADALSAYMSYGFIDETAPAIRSIPLQLPVPDVGTIIVDAYTFSSDADRLPEKFVDIQYYFPHINRTGPKEIKVSHLMIPSDGAPEPLRRILEFLITVLAPNIPKKLLKKHVRTSEEHIILKNIKYYEKLKTLFESECKQNINDEKFNDLKKLINLQETLLFSYRKRNL